MRSILREGSSSFKYIGLGGGFSVETVLRMMARSGAADRRTCRFYPIAGSHQSGLEPCKLCVFERGWEGVMTEYRLASLSCG